MDHCVCVCFDVLQEAKLFCHRLATVLHSCKEDMFCRWKWKCQNGVEIGQIDRIL